MPEVGSPPVYLTPRYRSALLTRRILPTIVAATSHDRRPVPSFLRSAFLGYCPNCLLGKLFDGLLRPRHQCTVCGLAFEHEGSTFTMTAFIHYMLICAFLTIEGLTLGLIFGIFPGFMLVLGASATVLFLLLHRPVRGLWVWCLWKMELLE